MSKKKKKVTVKSNREKRMPAKHKHAKSEAKWPVKPIVIGVGIFLVVIILGYVGYHYVSENKAGSATVGQTQNTTSTFPNQGKVMQWSNPPPMSIDQAKEYFATIKTNFGDIVVQLFPKDAPIAVNNFVFLARQGFYDGLKFHRVVNGFVIQGGDPKSNGTGGPGYKFADEKVTRDYVNGTLAMANSGPDTNGSQFFITLADLTGKLPKSYTIFGQVINGRDVVQKIGNTEVKASLSGEVSTPVTDVIISGVTIEEE